MVLERKCTWSYAKVIDYRVVHRLTFQISPPY
jgi:hypothetical protein